MQGMGRGPVLHDLVVQIGRQTGARQSGARCTYQNSRTHLKMIKNQSTCRQLFSITNAPPACLAAELHVAAAGGWLVACRMPANITSYRFHPRARGADAAELHHTVARAARPRLVFNAHSGRGRQNVLFYKITMLIAKWASGRGETLLQAYISARFPQLTIMHTCHDYSYFGSCRAIQGRVQRVLLAS